MFPWFNLNHEIAGFVRSRPSKVMTWRQHPSTNEYRLRTSPFPSSILPSTNGKDSWTYETPTPDSVYFTTRWLNQSRFLNFALILHFSQFDSFDSVKTSFSNTLLSLHRHCCCERNSFSWHVKYVFTTNKYVIVFRLILSLVHQGWVLWTYETFHLVMVSSYSQPTSHRLAYVRFECFQAQLDQ